MPVGAAVAVGAAAPVWPGVDFGVAVAVTEVVVDVAPDPEQAAGLIAR